MIPIWASYGLMFAMTGLLCIMAARNRAAADRELVAVSSADKGYLDQVAVVTLFDSGGRFLQMPSKRWARALATAMANGWRPTGAAPPPRHWGLNVRPQPQEHWRSEEHTSELQSPCNLVCRLLLEKKKQRANQVPTDEATAGRRQLRT